MSGMEIFLAAASSAASALGTLAGGQASAQAHRYNAALAERAAAEAGRRAAFDEGRARDRAARLLSAQRARFAVSGADPNTGTPLLVAEDSAVQAEIDALAIRHGGRAEADAHRMRAAADRADASSALQAGLWGAGTSLLTSASSLWPPTGSSQKGR